MTFLRSTCSYCGVGCGVLIKKNPHTGEIHLKGDESHPASRGKLCSKGMNLHHVAMDTSDRLTVPRMRVNRQAPLQDVSWETALNRAAAVFKGLIDKFGPDSVGFYLSGQLLTEEYYIINKLTKGFIGTNNIDTNSRLCMSSAVVGYKKSLGEDAVPVSYDDIELADCFFIAGANPAWCHPILFRRIEAHKLAHPDVKIIVVDPRHTQSASIADLHLPIIPGADIYLFNAIARVLIEQGKMDAAFIAEHTNGFEHVQAKVFELSLDEYAEKCGVPAADIVQAALWIGDAKGFISMWTMGLNQSVVGVNKNLALINLSLITGKIGKPGNGPFSLTGQPNAMGGREVGGLSTMLAVHKEINNPIHRQEVADFWGVPSVPDRPGLSAMEMIDALEAGRMKAVWIVCTNPIDSMPNARRVEAALRKANFVIVQDISKNASSLDFADLILPAAGYMEKSGTMTNADRRVSLVQKITAAPAQALPDAEIIWRFAAKMGWQKSFNYSSYEQIFDEYKMQTKGTNVDVSGLSHAYLKANGSVQWPFSCADSKGTPRLFTDHRFYTPDARANMFAVAPDNASESTDAEFPLILTTGRIRDQWHTMTRTGKVSKLNKHIPEPFVEIHPNDAARMGIINGDLVDVRGRRGDVRVRAKLTDTIREGVVFLPMHWGRIMQRDAGRANNLTHDLIDPTSKQPDFKFSAVNVRKYAPEMQKIIVIGAGAGAGRFIEAMRECDQQSDIHVFSKEVNPFYNRVLLPEYLSGHKGWDHLLRFKAETLQALNVTVHNGVAVDRIDPESNTLVDANGVTHSYTRLVVATGSRAFVPADYPMDKSNMFTIRQREDVERIQALLKPNARIVIVGGGLLGLEMADAFDALGHRIDLIQQSDRLMPRQLDALSGQLLKQQIEEKNIVVHLNDQVVHFVEDSSDQNRIAAIKLKTGKTLHADIVMCAIGTTPNIEMLRAAGLACGRGVKVNSRLQSSVDNIYCIGEIAELDGMMWGITAAAEEQADVLAKVMYGDPHVNYKGSTFMNILKLKDIHLSSVGMIEEPLNDDAYQVVRMEDVSRHYYKKCIIHNNKLVGTILMGNKDEFVQFRDLIKNGAELDDLRDALLRPNGGAVKEPLKGALVCSCNNVGEGNIKGCIAGGCKTLSDVMQKTGAGTGCGSCKPEIMVLLEQAKQTKQTKQAEVVA